MTALDLLIVLMAGFVLGAAFQHALEWVLTKVADRFVE